VVPRTSAFRFKGAAADIREIGAQLRVNAVLEGSVRRVGDTIRISVQLADVATGYHLWAETFERPLRGILALQDEITRAVVDSLKIKLAVREGQAPPRDAEDPEAYELYLRGLHAWNRRTEQSFHQAIRFLEQALRRNPGHARSWATLASCQIGLLLSSAVDPRRVIPEAREAAAKALALAPGLADALAARALIHAVYDHNWKASEADFDLALRHAPHHPTIREWYALTCLVPAGRLDQAIAQLHTAVDLDPISVILHSQLGFALYLQRRFEDAVRQLRLALELDPAFYRAYWDLGMAYIQLERFDEALEVLEQARQTDASNPFRWGALGYAYARAGREAQAHAVLEQLQRLSANRYVSSTCIAEIQVALGSHAAAMDTLTSAVEQHAHRLIWIGADPIYDPLRQEIGFRALCTAIGLAS
jgi:tetratricopeptide (TPR) repeat protein